jgi:chlorite dismutase
MADTTAVEAPQTLEGWYMLHDVYAVDWAAWRGLEAAERDTIAAGASQWLIAAAGCERGDSALYSVTTQKGDLMFVHYRESPDEVNRAELAMRQTRLFDFLIPRYSYLSTIEISLYELTAIARIRLGEKGIKPGSDEYGAAFEKEMEGQKQRVQSRLYRDVPEHRYICFYPMSKRRGETVNWYTLSVEERRNLMRGHGRIGHKYHDCITQIIGGSVGFDDWEWGVSLHSNDALTFKKLIYEMRFDPATSRFAEFGPFYVGIRTAPEDLPALLSGTLPDRET